MPEWHTWFRWTPSPPCAGSWPAGSTPRTRRRTSSRPTASADHLVEARRVVPRQRSSLVAETCACRSRRTRAHTSASSNESRFQRHAPRNHARFHRRSRPGSLRFRDATLGGPLHPLRFSGTHKGLRKAHRLAKPRFSRTLSRQPATATVHRGNRKRQPQCCALVQVAIKLRESDETSNLIPRHYYLHTFRPTRTVAEIRVKRIAASSVDFYMDTARAAQVETPCSIRPFMR